MRFAYVIETEFVPTLQESGVEIEIVDNDRKAHKQGYGRGFWKFGVKVWPGSGFPGERKRIVEFTGKAVDDLGSFPKIHQPLCPWIKA